jgi:hypothetical protein
LSGRAAAALGGFDLILLRQTGIGSIGFNKRRKNGVTELKYAHADGE